MVFLGVFYHHIKVILHLIELGFLLDIIDDLETCVFKPLQVIIEKGDVIQGFYIIHPEAH